MTRLPRYSAHNGDACTGHELLHALRLAAGVIVAIAFQEIDDAPHAKASAQRNNEGGKGAYRRSEKCHIVTSI